MTKQENPASRIRKVIAELDSGASADRIELFGRDCTEDMQPPTWVETLCDIPVLIKDLWVREKRRSFRDRAQRSGHIYTIAELRQDRDLRAESWLLAWWQQRRGEDRSGQQAWKKVAVAWRFSEELGAPLVEILRVIAQAVDDEEEASRQQRSAQAGPQVSSRILSVLPLVGICGALLVGVNPWDFYVSSLFGVVTAVVGFALMGAGYGVSRVLVRRCEQEGQYSYDVALMMNLTIAGLNSGSSIPAVLRALALSCGVEQLLVVADSLLRGVPWWHSWALAPAECEGLAAALEVAWCEGGSPIEMLRSGGWEWSRELRARRDSASAHLGVRLLLPLGLLQLPSFIALGVVPVIIHIADSV